MSIITNCVVSNGQDVVLDNPTRAEVFKDMSPERNITITGGTRHTPLVSKKAYTIKGTVNNEPQAWKTMKCTDTGNPAKFAN